MRTHHEVALPGEDGNKICGKRTLGKRKTEVERAAVGI